MKVPLPACTGVVVLSVVVACAAEGSGEPEIIYRAPDAGPAEVTKTLPTEPRPKKDAGRDGTDNDGDGDDDDLSDFPDAGVDAGKPASTYRYRVFITSERFSGNIGGLEGADDACARAAAAANLDGGKTWKAWLSTSVENAIERLVDRSPWYLVNRSTIVFKSFAGLSFEPAHPISRNELGKAPMFGLGPTANRVWTGTGDDGKLTTGKNCSNWRDDTVGKRGVAGAFVETPSTTVAASWTHYAIQPEEGCHRKWPIYCFEQ